MPQVLSREQHENLTDSKLVHKHTQAKQRSDAVAPAGSSATAAPMPAAQRTQIVQNICKNSVGPSTHYASVSTMSSTMASGADAGSSGYSFGVPLSNSPPAWPERCAAPGARLCRR